LAYLARKELKKLEQYSEIRLNNSKYYLEKINNKNIEILPLLKERAGARTNDYN